MTLFRCVTTALFLAAMAPAFGYAEDPAQDQAKDSAIFGHETSGNVAFACFSRAYDKAHLKAHPQQNVTSMTMLVQSVAYEGEEPGRQRTVILDVHFRGNKKPFQTSGGCFYSDDDKGLHCNVDCDGGAIGVRVKDGKSVLVDIPGSARIWDPSQPDDAEPGSGVPENARFGEDDKTFRLDRIKGSQCETLAYGDDVKAALRADK